MRRIVVAVHLGSAVLGRVAVTCVVDVFESPVTCIVTIALRVQDGKSAMTIAALEGHHKCVLVLASNGVDVNTVDWVSYLRERLLLVFP